MQTTHNPTNPVRDYMQKDGETVEEFIADLRRLIAQEDPRAISTMRSIENSYAGKFLLRSLASRTTKLEVV